VQCELIITGGTVLSMRPGSAPVPDGAVAVRGSEIVAVATAAELFEQAPTATVLDAGGGLILPGFVNTHTHLAMTLMRGLADDLALKPWLEEHVWPAERKLMNSRTVVTGTRLAVAESLRAGVTCACDMYFFADTVGEAVAAMGMRGVIAESLLDFPTPAHPSPEASLGACRDVIARFTGHPLIVPAVAPHAPYSVSPTHLVHAAELAEEHGVPLVTHLSETRWEVDTIRADKGVSPVAYLADLGVLSERTVAAHCVHVSEEALALLAEFNVGVASTPASNLKLGSGVAPLPQMLAHSIKVAFGTDGAASNNTLDLLRDAQLAALLYKGLSGDPTSMPARTLVELLTIGGARELGLDDIIGTIEPGKRADIVCLSLDGAHSTPMFDPFSHVAYAARAADVRHVVVDGRVVVQDRQLVTADEAGIIADARAAAASLRM
jgi:5-methylthioadenosine/S-adenosylhomocysteine deaminase